MKIKIALYLAIITIALTAGILIQLIFNNHMTQDTFFCTIAILGGFALLATLIYSEYDHYHGCRKLSIEDIRPYIVDHDGPAKAESARDTTFTNKFEYVERTPMYFVTYTGDLTKDPLDHGIKAFDREDKDQAREFIDKYLSKGYACQLYSARRLVYPIPREFGMETEQPPETKTTKN